ncbi:B3 domain-containing protein REM3 [Arabidopsis lyrata subsp. lyrata]|uniref:B3 domain-containing protein REM3 n=1 Tax=Arabidopsis lyrata subsp. lyrata TaxID=81972 RepID=UPI000A29C890|nr:B3 domain-containing protein REM3 [Arabidopsis lyrata subsp. lyrata]|eukprot:XP_020872303.1 B3 domain-containing protein REM3 [Arabidopsis lyrata subsp. lyrata]
MANPLSSSQSNRPFFVRSLAGHNSNLIIPDAFFTAHLKDKTGLTKLKLTSDASDRTWDVKLNGRRFAGGWDDFSAAHCLRDDDVLVFRHDGKMVFHVTPSGRSFSQIHTSSSYGDYDNDDNDDDGGDSDDEDDNYDDDDETGGDDSDPKKETRFKGESFSSENSCFLGVTPSNLRLNRVSFSKHFSRTNGLTKRWCVIDLMNLSGESWALGLRHNNRTGQDYIRGHWRSFCRANEMKPGSSYRFKLVRNGTRPLLRLCSEVIPEGNRSRANGKDNVSEKYSRAAGSASTKQNKFLTVTFKHYMIQSGHLRLPRSFARENGIKEAEEIILVDKNGVKWPSYVASAKQRGEFYMAHGWKRFCEANKLNTGDTFTLEFVRGEDTTPMLKFCSKAKVKIEQEEAPEETETPFQKRARVSAEVGHSRRTQTPNKASHDPKILQRKQPLQPCSFSDQAKKVKQSIVNILTGIKRFRSELEIKEQSLEAALLEIDALGEKVSEINKILK